MLQRGCTRHDHLARFDVSNFGQKMASVPFGVVLDEAHDGFVVGLYVHGPLKLDGLAQVDGARPGKVGPEDARKHGGPKHAVHDRPFENGGGSKVSIRMERVVVACQLGKLIDLLLVKEKFEVEIVAYLEHTNEVFGCKSQLIKHLCEQITVFLMIESKKASENFCNCPFEYKDLRF